ncbi:hypothetical protein [Flavobacterium laiguense]|uniref:Uncharacterized protein n=1 Tax=Flavobacterium laiguense TaxID=2169409 RepID=A0A2U1JR36_9FLAO|nr:hypothetical protein [Flavobacterium laiguense]PWA07656.1 hypothetical protein DB891_14215 [Flavobacterium laiguense]
MNAKKENPKINKVEEPSVDYEVSKIKFKDIDRTTFDFDEEMKNGYTLEQFKAEMHKRIRTWRGK